MLTNVCSFSFIRKLSRECMCYIATTEMAER